jgi:hypothetical protein
MAFSFPIISSENIMKKSVYSVVLAGVSLLALTACMQSGQDDAPGALNRKKILWLRGDGYAIQRYEACSPAANTDGDRHWKRHHTKKAKAVKTEAKVEAKKEDVKKEDAKKDEKKSDKASDKKDSKKESK